MSDPYPAQERCSRADGRHRQPRGRGPAKLWVVENISSRSIVMNWGAPYESFMVAGGARWRVDGMHDNATCQGAPRAIVQLERGIESCLLSTYTHAMCNVASESESRPQDHMSASAHPRPHPD